MKRRISKCAIVLPVICALASWTTVFGQTADDVICDKCVDTSDIAPGAIANARLADGAVNSVKIKNGTVKGDDLADLTISTGKIQKGAITASKIQDEAIGSDKIRDGQVFAKHLADGIVTAKKIQNDAIGSDKIREGQVFGKHLADGVVSGAKIQDGSLLGGDVSTFDTGPVHHQGWFSVQQTPSNQAPFTHLSDQFGELQWVERTIVGDSNDPMIRWLGAGTHETFAEVLEVYNGSNNIFQINFDGSVNADGSFNATGPNSAQMVRVGAGAATVRPGDVLVIDTSGERSFALSQAARSTLVAGIYSARSGAIGSDDTWDVPMESIAHHSRVAELNLDIAHGRAMLDVAQRAVLLDEVPLAVSGIVTCNVSAENGAIRPGDLLVTSGTPGHAMRDGKPLAGTVVGKALGSLDSGLGTIKVLATLQ